MNRRRLLQAVTVIGVSMVGGVIAANNVPYKNDPAIVAKLEALGDNESVWIGNARVEGLSDAHKKNSWLSTGPFTRGYCHKMPYAPDRKTAFYCGQDHNLPHYNDCWEYHLGSNTWHCLASPDGGDTGRYWRDMGVKVYGRNGQGIEKDEAKRKALEAELKAWAEKHIVLKDGYLQMSENGGPIFAWHTWDGLTYDPVTGRMYWAVLDSDDVMEGYLKRYCEITGKNFEELKPNLKPGMGLWSFDPKARKWARSQDTQPHPRMRGMGGFLQHIPDLKKTIWYASSQNVSPHEYTMWALDTAANKWTEIKPNGGKDIGTLSVKEKVAPSSEMQVAYSAKHKKLVAVQARSTFIYDVVKNEWTAGPTNPDLWADDTTTVFAYDDAGDVFLLLQPNTAAGSADYSQRPFKWFNHAVALHAFSLVTGKWEKLTPKGAGVASGKVRMKGYYDPEHNAFVATDQGNVWVYRYKKAK